MPRRALIITWSHAAPSVVKVQRLSRNAAKPTVIQPVIALAFRMTGPVMYIVADDYANLSNKWTPTLGRYIWVGRFG